MITFCRAVPDLVFAVLLVRAMGIGVLPGVLALALHSIGMVAKLFADAIEQTATGPREAVRSTGAGPLRELVSGVLPQVIPSWISTSLGALVEVADRMLPPDFSLVGMRLVEAVLETLAIGLVATAIGVVLSVPLGLLAARNVAPHPAVYWCARSLVVGIRAIPELILAVVFVAAIGLGPIAGVCALGLGSIGFLGKLLADAAEEIDPGPREAIRAAGGGWWQELFSAVIPQALPAMIGSGLYLLDVNIRTSTILGIVGAGGVGFLLFEAVRTLNFEFAGAIVLIIFLVVLVIERLSGWVRSQVA